MNGKRKALVVIVGANEGGKSTFLRSLGVVKLMMQCCMFVRVDYFSSGISNAIYSYYKHEEDAELNSGRLDGALERMSAIADTITLHSLVLFDESFSAPNEREGSTILRNVITALLEATVPIVFMTCFFDLSHVPYTQHLTKALFLQAHIAKTTADGPPHRRGRVGLHQLRRRPLCADLHPGVSRGLLE